MYILTTRQNTVLYTGVTNSLYRRIEEHKSHQVPGFTAKYNVDKLVYYEEFELITDAILREKRIKRWNRKWKEELIARDNPGWQDLYFMI